MTNDHGDYFLHIFFILLESYWILDLSSTAARTNQEERKQKEHCTHHQYYLTIRSALSFVHRIIMSGGSFGFGVLFQLQVKGLMCPCLLSSEDANARQAVRALNSGTCRRVQVHAEKHNSSGSIGGFLGGLFGRRSTGDATATTRSSSSSNTISSSELFTSQRQQTSFLAKLALHDCSADGQPAIFIDPVGNSVVVEEDEEKQQRGSPTAVASYNNKRTVKLRRVDKVLLEGDEIVLKSKVKSSHPSRELLRFTVLQCNSEDDVDVAAVASKSEVLPVTQDTRNMLVHHFMVLAEWERQRRAALHASDPDTYNDDSEDEDNDEAAARTGGATNFIAARAQKAAHFAKRELELQRTKKDREQRKAKLISEAGGLKYTAIAMANMHSPAPPS